MLLIYLYGKNHFNIAINSYVLFLLIMFADKINFETMSRRTEFVYTSLVIFITFVFVLVYQYLAGKRYKLATVFSYTLAVILYTIPLFYLIYALNFGTKITEDVMYAIFQKNWNESFEFTRTFISPLWLIVVCTLAVFSGYLLLKQEKKETAHIEVSLLLFIIVFTFGTTKVLKHDIRLYYFAKDGVKNYAKELEQFKALQEKRKAGTVTFQAHKQEKDETYIVVIGESLNKRHMGVYGYFRDTTPLLTSFYKKHQILRYTIMP
jgi:heptose-I-phosphate ethanolaminephosphotransferase